MPKVFIVISGLPGAGKTTLARRLAPALGLPLIDKDEILAGLFHSQGIGDANWRRKLSRESDAILRDEATRSSGAILSSFWHLRGMPPDSGTPTEWLDVPAHRVINVHCVCELNVAADRFLPRGRHPGHLDGELSRSELLDNLRNLSELPPLTVGPTIAVNTTSEPDVSTLVGAIEHTLKILA
jgi:hypothetical protein